MSEALRSIFAEFGFDIDANALDKLDQRVVAAAKGVGALPKAAEDASVRTEAAMKKIGEARVRVADAAAKEKVDHAGKALFDASAEGKAHAAWKRLAAAEEAAKKPITGLIGLLEKLHTKIQTGIGKAMPAAFQKAFRSMGVAEGDFAAMGQLASGATAGVVAVITKAVQAAFAFGDAFSAQSEALRDTARDLRISTTALQEFDHVAVQSGVGVDRMRAGLTKFSTDLRGAERYGNGTTFMLRRLGVQARGADGHIRPVGDLMGDVAAALDHVQNPLRRTRVAVHLFGEAGRRMLDVMHGGAGGLRELQESFAELGGGVTPEATEAARAYTQQMGRMNIATDSLRSVLATSLLPALSWVLDKGAKLLGWAARMTRGTDVVKIVLFQLAGAGVVAAGMLIAAWAPVVGPILAVALAAAAMVLFWDDFIGLIKGKDSLIGRFFDSFLGARASAQYVHELRAEWDAVTAAITAAYRVLRDFISIIPGGGIGRVVDAVTGRGSAAAAVAHDSPAPPPSTPTGQYTDANGVTHTPIRRPPPRPAPAVHAIPTSQVTVSGAGGLIVPIARAVTAPAAPRARGNTTVIHRTSAPVLHFHGVTDSRALAAEVRTVLREEDQNQRDADHPQPDDDA